MTAQDILDYYATQMAARGWIDATEESFNLYPEGRDDGIISKGVQDTQYLEIYRKVKDSNLVLQRGSWSMHITAEPSPNGLALTSIRILVLSTPSVRDFAISMVAALARPLRDSAESRMMELVEQQGDARYHTTISVKNLEPSLVFTETLIQLHRQNWQLMAQISERQAYFAWLAKGKLHAALYVVALFQGRTLVAHTEVMPE